MNMENKSDKFKRLANNRVNKTLKSLDLVGNLADSYSYKYSPDEADQIIKALGKKIEEIKNKFNKNLDNKPFELQGE